MSYKVISTKHFTKELKRIAKKHKAIKADVLKLIEELEVEPTKGVDIGGNYYKIRLSISGTNKGKSGGARVITFVILVEEAVYLTEVYLKSERETADTDVIGKRLKEDGIV
jgi:mRNA-degrading endonuclease RelE of RelBE toxin-antitoxin system